VRKSVAVVDGVEGLAEVGRAQQETAVQYLHPAILAGWLQGDGPEPSIWH
jgi:hypothetical protein